MNVILSLNNYVLFFADDDMFKFKPLMKVNYIRIAADLIERTPEPNEFHRVTATASPRQHHRNLRQSVGFRTLFLMKEQYVA